MGYRYNEKIDIWSVGCILAELYSGKVLFPSDSNQYLLAQVVSCFGAFPLEMLTQECRAMHNKVGPDLRRK